MSIADRELDALYRRPGFLIRQAHQIAVAVFVEACAAFDITPGQYGAMVIVRGEPGLDQGRLARRIGLDRSTAGSIVARLEERGLVERPVGAGRRTRALALTAAGLELLEKLQPAVAAAQERLLGPLDAAERAQFLDLLQRLIQAHEGISRAPFERPTVAA